MNEQIEIKLKNIQLITEFYPAITGLGTLSIKNLATLMRVAKAKKKTDELVREYNQLRTQIAEQDCEKTDKGKPKVEDGSYVYKNDKVKEQTKKLLFELEQTEVSISLLPIEVSSLLDVEGLTANTIVALREFIIE